MKILILMILAHIIDDFVLQPQCLSELKQKDYWYRKGIWKGIWKFDFLCAGLIHSISWSCMIVLPVLFLKELTPQLELYIKWVTLANIIVHFIVDNLKANMKHINLWIDQLIHFLQIFVSYAIFTYN